MGEQKPLKQRAILVGAGEGAVAVQRLAPGQSGDVLICADGGRRKLEALGLKPDWYVGDNDSGGCPDGLPSVLLPPEKDVSDMEMAVDKALELGCREIILTGCSGGRLDHLLANLGLLERIEAAKAQGMLLDGENEVRLLRPGHYRILNQPPAHYLGLIALDETVEGLTLKGVKYPLERFTLHRGNTRTVSNEILPGEAAELSFQRGSLYVIRSGFCDTQPADRRLKV